MSIYKLFPCFKGEPSQTDGSQPCKNGIYLYEKISISSLFYIAMLSYPHHLITWPVTIKPKTKKYINGQKVTCFQPGKCRRHTFFSKMYVVTSQISSRCYVTDGPNLRCHVTDGRFTHGVVTNAPTPLKGIYTPAGSLTFSNSGLPDHHSPTL